MYKNILVPTDLTDRTAEALAIAARMTDLDGGRITLLHVIELIQDTEFDDFNDFYRKLKSRAERRMDRFIAAMASNGPLVEKEILVGRRVTDIVQYAKEREIDLMVLSSHRIDPENPVQGWGTISYKVSILSECPVMLIK